MFLGIFPGSVSENSRSRSDKGTDGQKDKEPSSLGVKFLHGLSKDHPPSRNSLTPVSHICRPGHYLFTLNPLDSIPVLLSRMTRFPLTIDN